MSAGRHARPRERSLSAAPAVAVSAALAGAGVLGGALPAQAATTAPAPRPRHAQAPPEPRALIAPVDPSMGPETMVVVQPGDTLSEIASRVSISWPRLWAANRAVIGGNPNLIYAGERLRLVAGHLTAAERAVVSPAAAPVAPVRTLSVRHPVSHLSPAPSGGFGGTLGCAALEQLWDSAGGNPAAAFMAAEVARAESGGEEFAIDHDANGTDDLGYWQINTSNGDATYDPEGNARAAVAISDDGTNWDPWVTYQHGLEAGQC